MIMNFFCWKYKFIKHSKIPIDLNFKFTLGVYYIFDSVLLVFCIGYLLGDIFIIQKKSFLTIIMLIITFIDIIFKKTIKKKFSPKHTEISDVEYKTA